MIFAVVDYFQYRYRLGKYSHEAMIKDGWLLAISQNFSNYRSCVVGDIIFASTAESRLSWAVMYFTQSVVSHTAMFYGDGIVHDCTTAGVLRHSFTNYLDGKSYIKIMRVPDIPEDKRHQMKSFMDKTLGNRYAWHKVIWLFLSIIFGAHQHFSWRFYIDIAFVLGATWFACNYLSPILGMPFLVILVAYSVAVLLNQVRKRKKPHA